MPGTDKEYVDDGTRTVDHFSARAGETIYQGDMVAISDSDGYLYRANAATGDDQEAPAAGLAEVDGDAGDWIEVYRLGRVRGASSLNEGQPVHLGESDGEVQAAEPSDSGDIVQVVGQAISASLFMLDVQADYSTVT